MKKGEIYQGRIGKLSFPNKGIATVDGVDVVIKNTLPGQEVSFILSKNKAGLKEGRLLSVLERSETEILPGCSVCDQCGGCVYQRIPYEEELAIKDRMAREILGKALKQYENAHEMSDGTGEDADGSRMDAPCGGAERLGKVYEGITGSPVMAGYRNKMEFSFGNAVKDGPITLGMHTPGHFMDVIDTPDCNIIDEDFRLIREAVLAYAKERGLSFYHRFSNTGYLRNLLVRKGINTGEILVDIVTTSEDGLDDKGFEERLRSLPLLGVLTGILHTIHDGVADAVINEGTSVIWGRDHIYDEILGLRFKISVFSFFQTNTKGAEVLYERVREYVSEAVADGAGPKRSKDRTEGFPDIGDRGDSRCDAGIVYDLYSGTGTIAQLLAETASKVYGVEIVPEAVEAARVNAELNGIKNVEFLCGDVLKVLDEVSEKPDLIILDPPRDGVNPKALRKILDYGVKNIVYVSCKITSFARDLQLMLEEGYHPKRISVIDMFPRTSNMETCVLLSHQQVKKSVTIDYTPDGSYMDGLNKHATYKGINEYVREKYGFKLHSAYIAQVKREMGIEMGENYNLSKSDDYEPREVTPEKRAAIIDALKHFNMIE